VTLVLPRNSIRKRFGINDLPVSSILVRSAHGSIALLVIVGVLLEGLPSLNVLAPLLIPIAGKLGLSELHYALVLIIAMGIGGFMPLAGVGFFLEGGFVFELPRGKAAA
jgi:Tripartite ATP-independent periplasmic transporter, DctM component